jgi:hypothetical protein
MAGLPAIQHWPICPPVIKHGLLDNPPFNLSGGLNPFEKYARQLGWLFPIYGKIKNVPNHQSVIDYVPIKTSISRGFPSHV